MKSIETSAKGIKKSSTCTRIHAQKLYKRGKYRESLRVCEEIYTTTPSNIDNLILLGAIHFQLRNWSESIFYSQQCIRVENGCAEAYCIIGNVLKEMNDLDSAINFMNKAIRYNPRLSDAYNNLGLVLFFSGKSHDAIEAFKVATSLNPSHCDALCNIASVYKVVARNSDSKEKYLEAIRLNPQCAIGWSNLGGIFNDNGDFQKAVDCYHHALKIMPNFADALSNSGHALFNLGGKLKNNTIIDQAAKRYKEALEIRPDFALGRACYGLFCYKTGLNSKLDAKRKLWTAILQDDTCFDAMNNLAAIHYEEGQLDSALKLTLRVLKQKPNHWCVYNNIGNILKEKGMITAAALCYQSSIRLNNVLAEPHSSCGVLLVKDNREMESFHQFQTAIKMSPLSPYIYMNMGVAYLSIGRMEDAEKCLSESTDGVESFYNLAVLYQRRGDLKKALSFAEQAVGLSTNSQHKQVVTRLMIFLKASICDWSFHHHTANLPNEACFREAFTTELPHLDKARVQNLQNEEKIRLGYILPKDSVRTNFNDLYRSHDSSKFEVFRYEIAAHSHVGNIKSQVATDGIHILIFTMNVNCLSSHKRIAPIQISLYEANADVEEIDFVISDQEGHHENSSSKILVVPGMHYEVEYKEPGNIPLERDEGTVDLRSQYGVSDDAFVYGYFQQPYHISSELFDVWMNILNKTDNTCLLLVRHNDQMVTNLRTASVKRRINPDRLIFMNHVPHDEHLKRYSMVDLYLDSCVRSGRRTIYEALLSATPTICIQGVSADTRTGSNALMHIGLDELVVQSIEDFEQLAISLQSDEDRFIDIIRKLDDALADDRPLFESKEWIHQYEVMLERALQIMTSSSDRLEMTATEAK